MLSFMYKVIVTLLIITFSASLTSCSNEDPFRVSADQVGPLTKSTKADAIKALFEKDSVVDQNASGMVTASSTFNVFEKKGKELLKITTTTAKDTATIQTVQILDPRYKTDKDININSTFKDIKDAYTISKIETLLTSVVVFVDDINAYFVIDKSELPGNLRFDRDRKIEKAQIPNGAKIKYFMIGW